MLLRRVPWKVIIDPQYKESRELKHIVQLAKEKDVSLEFAELHNYKCCAIIKRLSDV